EKVQYPKIPFISSNTNRKVNVRANNLRIAFTLGSSADSPSTYAPLPSLPPCGFQTVNTSPFPHPRRLPLSHASNCSLQTSSILLETNATFSSVGLSPNRLTNLFAKSPLARK